MTAPVLQLPVKVLRSATAGRRPGDGTFRALIDGEVFINTQDRVLCYLGASGTLLTVPFDPAFFAALAPLASPVLTGTPTTSSPAASDNSQQIAPTSWVQSLLSAFKMALFGTAVPAMDGTASAGSTGKAADAGHVHPTDTSRAPLASPAFTGAPTAPTPAVADNSTSLVTTAFLAGVTNRGDLKQSLASAYKHLLRYNMSAAPWAAMARNNLIVNPRMVVAQYGATGTISAANYVTDQWYFALSGITATAGRITSSPFPSRPDLPNALQVTISAAKTTLASGDYLSVLHMIEGNRIRHLLFGTANAKPLALGVLMRPSIAATVSVAVQNGAGNRTYVQTVALAANTDTFVSLVYPGDTAGTWAADTSKGMQIIVTLAGGTTTAAGAWAGNATSAGAGMTNFAAIANATFTMSDMVALPIGDPATDPTTVFPADQMPFLVRPDDEELRLCQRYWAIVYASLQGYASGAGGNYRISSAIYFPTSMRSVPALTLVSAAASTGCTPSTANPTTGGATFQIDPTTTGAVYDNGRLIAVDARL